VTEIASTANAHIKQWRQLLQPSGRRAHGLFLAEGEHLTREALHAGAALALILLKEEKGQYIEWLESGLPVYVVSRQVISVLTDSKTPQASLALCRLPEPPPLGKAGPRLIALNQLQDPGNVGTILRTMDAAKFEGLLIDPGCADPFSPKALRASMGAVFRVPVYPCEDLAAAFSLLPQHNIIAGDLKGGPYYGHPSFGGKVCILVGNEGAGLEERLLRLADYRLKLPMPGGAESLNAAVSAALMMYDVLLREDK
jgi:TrmH family RNA methyltransferase